MSRSARSAAADKLSRPIQWRLYVSKPSAKNSGRERRHIQCHRVRKLISSYNSHVVSLVFKERGKLNRSHRANRIVWREAVGNKKNFHSPDSDLRRTIMAGLPAA